jgi:hypothetical protein
MPEPAPTPDPSLIDAFWNAVTADHREASACNSALPCPRPTRSEARDALDDGAEGIDVAS